jgi:hypothetical protein
MVTCEVRQLRWMLQLFIYLYNKQWYKLNKQGTYKMINIIL